MRFVVVVAAVVVELFFQNKIQLSQNTGKIRVHVVHTVHTGTKASVNRHFNNSLGTFQTFTISEIFEIAQWQLIYECN